jgi:asparagine synthase (glutamine-hydrolysing)
LITVNIREDCFWEKISNEGLLVHIKGYIYSHKISEIVEKVKNLEIEEVEDFVNSIDGHFSIVVQKDDFSFIAVDKIRSTPVFFTRINKLFFVDSDPKRLVSLDDFNKSIIADSILEISMSGYTIGNKTLYDDLHSLKAGELVIFQENDYKYIQYYKYFGEIKNADYSDFLKELSQVTINVFKKMLSQVGDRQIIVPLSAGNDSRLVVSVLSYLGAKNVKCYSYGSSNNFEANIAKKIAQKLKYEWIFLPLTHKGEKKFYKSTEYGCYLEFSETYSSVPYIQGLSTIKYLKEINWIDDDAVFINGNSGDFISGAHISGLAQDIDVGDIHNEMKESILNKLIVKHFSLWSYLKTNQNIERIRENLLDELLEVCGEIEDKSKEHLFYECSEFLNRQSKYVITGQRSYEFYEHEWRLPLWDDEYLHFWQKVPAKYKAEQKLYIDMLKNNNFGNVWSDDIPVNKKTIKPVWIIPLRFLTKIPFSFFGRRGKKAWHQFEIVFFYYWMDNTRMMSTLPYWRVIKSFGENPQNHVSWQAVDYIRDKLKLK